MHADAQQRMPLIGDRAAWLEQLCARTAPWEVAHIGCTDTPCTEERLAAGVLLHQRLVEVAPVTGFDIDEGGLQLLRDSLPKERFILADLAKDIPESERGRYELAIAGEVLEHVPDADSFLRGCHQLLLTGGRLCVTVPNACSPKVGLRALAGSEVTHPDHRTYYSPRTIARTLQGAGFEPQWLASCLTPGGTLGELIYHPLLRTAHRLFRGPVGEGLIAVAQKQ